MADYSDYKQYIEYLDKERGSIAEIGKVYHSLYGEYLSYDYEWKTGTLIFYINGKPGGARVNSEILVDIDAQGAEDLAEEVCNRIIHPELKM